MYYQLGNSIAVQCIDKWTNYNGDYQVIGYTVINDMKLMGIDIEQLFIEKEQKELYDQLLEENRVFYILKHIERLNFEFKDKDNIPDVVNEYTYLCDDLIDFNNSSLLTKRSRLSANLFIGTFFSEKLDDKTIEITGYHKDVKNNLKSDLESLLNNYSDSFIVTFDDSVTLLQPLNDAINEDKEFIEKRKRTEQELLEQKQKEEEKKLYLINKENLLLEKEKEINENKTELNKKQKEMDEKLKEVQSMKDSMLASQNAIDKYEAYLAQKEAKLNLRAEKIKQREDELGISNSDL